MKRTLIAVFMGLGAAGWATGADALVGAAGGYCEDGVHHVSANGPYNPDVDGEIAGLVFRREAVGVCLPSELVPDEPVAVEIYENAEAFGWSFRASVLLPAPPEAAVFRYVPFVVRPDGSLEPLMFSGNGHPPRTLVSCTEVPFLRGTIVPDPDYSTPEYPLYTFAACAENCWTEAISNVVYTPESLADLLGAPIGELVGRTVDVYGTVAPVDLVPPPSHWITKVELTEGGGCGAVPAEGASWGGLKATYR
ncbi:MAG: hypothetical protein IH621_03860 [Krumholzibacteria bacterium]|nr:hypothetical protein [Candidatus Krumholzibacteria bacterium]